MISKIIDKLGSEPAQNIIFTLENGKDIYLYFEFSPVNSCWFVDIEYEDFVLKGIQLSYSDNILKQYSRMLPFGIQVDSSTGFSPMAIDSFINDLNRVIVNENS